ncbi:SAM-dependent methyltransferase, partial [Bacteroides ovatus]
SLQAAAEYFQVTKGVTLEMKPIVCHRSDANNQCIGKRCPFHPSHTIPQS